MEELENTGIIICSRIDSKRIPRKCLYEINGKSILEYLISRIYKTRFTIYLAIPTSQFQDYKFLFDKFPRIQIFLGSNKDPLKRMNDCAARYGIKNIIRVTHDKIYIDSILLRKAFYYFLEQDADYLYSSSFTDGSGFEIIKQVALNEAAKRFKNIEHISYAVKQTAKKIINYKVPKRYQSPCRLLIDYKKDLVLIEKLLRDYPSSIPLDKLIKNLTPLDYRLNLLPKLTVYTCAYNAERWLDECVESVMSQTIENFEYILIDDFSSDSTYRKMLDFQRRYKNIKVIRNGTNLGLASSSNIALEKARGKYIMRIDADDYLIYNNALCDLINCFTDEFDAVYPNNNHQEAHENHHIGCAMFKTKAINNIKFTERLRGYEGLDFWVRGKDLLRVKYLDKVIYHYRQHKDSMSRNNLKKRKILKQEILKNAQMA